MRTPPPGNPCQAKIGQHGPVEAADHAHLRPAADVRRDDSPLLPSALTPRRHDTPRRTPVTLNDRSSRVRAPVAPLITLMCGLPSGRAGDDVGYPIEIDVAGGDANAAVNDGVP